MIKFKRQLSGRSRHKGSLTIIYVVIGVIVVLGAVGGTIYYQKEKEKQELIRAKTSCEAQNTSANCTKYTYDDTSKTCLSQPMVPCCGNSSCETGERAACVKDCQITIEQIQKDTSYPVKFNTARNDFQKVAQTFVPAEDNLELTTIAPYIDYSLGEKAYFNIYELDDPKKPTSDKLLKSVELDISALPRQDFYPITLDPPIQVGKSKTYSFVVEVQSKTSEIGIGKISYQDLYKAGKAYYYFSLIGGNGEILENTFDWRYQNDDLAFKLSFLKQETTTEVSQQ